MTIRRPPPTGQARPFLALAIATVATVATLATACKDAPAPTTVSTDRVALPAAPLALPAASLSFAVEGRKLADLTPGDLVRIAPPVEIAVFDPYYKKPKRFRALPLAPMLAAAFAKEPRRLADLDFVLRARDGFTVPYPGARLTGDGGYIAFADLDVPGWEPIGEGRANPGPFYLVWTRPDQQALEDWPRPWQLASIEIARVEDLFPHALPPDVYTSSANPAIPEPTPAFRGFGTFRRRCILCHAINREGGRVGPELNVPQSIVEYRPVAQIKAYIRDPLTFRYGHMPAHPDLTDGDLDDLVAYFSAMKTRKHDPEAARAAPPPPANASDAGHP